MKTMTPRVKYRSMNLRIQRVDDQYIILGPRIHYRIMLLITPFTCIGLIVGGIFIPNYLMSISFAIVLLVFLLRTHGTKIVIDKFAESIVLDTQRCLFFHRRHEIPFLALRSLEVNEEEVRSWQRGTAGTYIYYPFVLKFEDETIEISTSENLEEIRQLAETISDFVEKPLVIRVSNAEYIREQVSELSREEIVAKWQIRKEDEKKERDKE